MTDIRRETFGEFSLLHRPASTEAAATVHFAHATGFNAETYRALLASFDPRLDVYALDARGHGMTRAAADPRKLHTWAPYRRDLEAFVETLSQPVVLAGHSMGATVSLELAAARPELVRGLVLIDPVVVPPSHLPLMAVARTLGFSKRLIPVAQMAARRRMEFPSKEAAVENYVGKGAFRTWDREWIEAYVDGGTVPSMDGGVRLSCERDWETATFANSSIHVYGAARKLRCPVTLLAAERDAPPFTQASREAFMRAKPDTRLLVLKDVTHFMAMERPEIAREEIERLAETAGSELG